MKNNKIRAGIVPIFIIITLVCVACKQQPDNGENWWETDILKTEIWNGIKFRQRNGVTDNQYRIMVNKFKVVFNSDSFTDEERAKFKNHTNSVLIDAIGFGGGWFADSHDSNFKLIVSVPCDSIQSGVKEIIKRILGDINKYFIDGEWQFYDW